MCFPEIVLELSYIEPGVAISLPIGRLPSKVGTPSQSWGTLSIAHISSSNSLSSRWQHHGHHNQQVILPRLSFFVLLFFALFIVDTISSKFSFSLGLTLTCTISLLLRLHSQFCYNFMSLLSVLLLLSLSSSFFLSPEPYRCCWGCPRFSEELKRGDQDELFRARREICEIIAVMTFFPLVLVSGAL